MRGLSKCAIVLDGSPNYKRKYTKEPKSDRRDDERWGNRDLSAKAKSMKKEKV